MSKLPILPHVAAFSSLSRRNVISALAASLASPAIASTAVLADDPIFAAIEEHRSLNAAYEAECEKNEDDPSEAENELGSAVLWRKRHKARAFAP
jgi:hypothetical protein